MNRITTKKNHVSALVLTLFLALSLTLTGCIFNLDLPPTGPGQGGTDPVEDLEGRINPTIMQAFYWEMNEEEYATNYPEEANLWNLIGSQAKELSDVGITAVWLPPASKGMTGDESVGYDVYDLWDLGEFNQRGTVRTKYGTKQQLANAISALHKRGIKVYFDAVLNHRMGADEQQMVPMADGGHEELWTKYTFPGRNGKYYDAVWDWTYFDGKNGRLFQGKEWDNTPDDYLMGADVDYQKPEVQDEIKAWGKWIVNDVGFDGFRLDAIRHVDNDFVGDWMWAVQNSSLKDVFFVGEAWIENTHDLKNYVDAINHPDLKVFDFPLYNVFRDQLTGGNLDMKSLGYAGTGLVNEPGYRERAVTFADNHDTNRDGGAWGLVQYKNQAYAYILMREHGIPVVWWKDYYVYDMKDTIDPLLKARMRYAYGAGHEVDNNDERVYSYVREGEADRPGSGLVMMIAGRDNGDIVTKEINSRQPNTTFYDLTGNIEGTVTTDANGYGQFQVHVSESKGWSIWVPKS